jgi:hypothetical protein
MGLIGLLTRRRQPDTAAWRSVTVVAATARDGLSAEDAFALRDIIVARAPLYHQFLNPGTFIACFSGNDNGTQAASQLASEMSAFSQRAKLASFGVGLEFGNCLASANAEGHFTSPPIGETISRAMHTATERAENAL